MNDLVTSETVIEPFLDVVRDQVARGKPFFDTLSKTLDVQADYNIWVQGKLRTNFANPDVDQQAEGCLNIWNDRNYGNMATRKDLVDTLRNNQRNGNCQALIVMLEDIASCSVNNNQKIPKASLKMKDLNESKNQNPDYDEADCNSEMTGAKTITKIGTQNLNGIGSGNNNVTVNGNIITGGTISNNDFSRSNYGNKNESNPEKDMYLKIIEKLLDKRDPAQKKFLSDNGGEEVLENMVTGAKEDDLLLFRKVIKSIGLLRNDENGFGTIFIAHVVGQGLCLLSAGHNFMTILNKRSSKETWLKLRKYSVMFSNINGENWSGNGNEDKLEKGKPMNMELLLKKFCVCGSISFNGNRRTFKRIDADKHLLSFCLPTKKSQKVKQKFSFEFKEGAEMKHPLDGYVDYCAILLDDGIKEELDALGLDYLECGTGQQLQHANQQCVSILGHPALKDDTFPFTISYGKEEDMSDDSTKISCKYDSLAGNSGSPVFGQHYKVKGIHVWGKGATNYVQKIEEIKSWIDLGRNIAA